MPSLPKKLIDSAADLGLKVAHAGAELAGRLRRDESDTVVPPPTTDTAAAPKPGAPGAPKSATAPTRRGPKAKTKAKPRGRGATAKAGPATRGRATD